MFVVVKRSKTSKRELVYIVESYRDENQRIRQRIIKKCGELSELLAEDPQAMEKLREEARRMSGESTAREVELSINLGLPNSESSPTVNYGYFFVESLFQSLHIDRFLDRRISDAALAKSLAATLRQLVIREFFGSLASPDPSSVPSFLFAGADQDRNPVPFLANLQPLVAIESDLQKHVYKMANKGHECTDAVASLDITSYFFNSTGTGEQGEAQTDESAMSAMILVQMGMLFDRYRNPAACVLFLDGKANDTGTLIKAIDKLKDKYRLEKVVVTSDRGIGSNGELAELYESGNGYVIGRRVKNSPIPVQEKILDEDGYKWNESGTFKFKSFAAERVVGNTVIPEKVISMWTSRNAAKMKQRRDRSLIDYLSSMGENASESYADMMRYVSIREASNVPGEQTSDYGFFSFDAESYARDVALDGYYALVTTETEIPEHVVVKRYHNLQKLGRAFAAPDSDVEGAPRELWSYADVEGYFLVAFITRVIERKLERMLGYKYDVDELKDALSGALCKNIGQDIFDFSVQTESFKDIEAAFGVEFDRSYATLEMIRKYRKEVIAAL
ncbi:MAG: IS1634 family transposase [Coriobacteriales bacterium]